MEQLAGHMAVFISKSSCGMYKLSLAANFKLLLELLHLTDIVPDFRSSFDPLGPDSVSWSTQRCPSDDNGVLLDPIVH